MRIRKFNESIDEGVLIFSVVDDDGEESVSFTSEILAADYFIKKINLMIEEDDEDEPSTPKFEPYFDDDGSRFFSNVHENPDYERCNQFCDRQSINVFIVESRLYSTVRTPTD